MPFWKLKSNDFWLVLGWWAARGFAHVWVIKRLEELNLQASEVSWTSMGAIVAACYAFGMTVEDMLLISSEVQYLLLIDFDLKSWLLAGNKIKNKLKEFFWEMRIERTRIPLKIISTNLNTWEKVVYTKWKIYDAVRASISIPWILAPYKYEWWDMIDGGIVNNLPIEEMKSKNIIAVSVLRDVARKINKKINILWLEVDKTFVGINYQIIQKTIDIMMKQNEDRSLEFWNKNVILIRPKFSTIDYYEFHKYEEIIEIWYKTAKKELAN